MTQRKIDKMWSDETYEKNYHTVAECEAVIKNLRDMVDMQQAYINNLLDKYNKLKFRMDGLEK
jgi:hypothetical protein